MNFSGAVLIKISPFFLSIIHLSHLFYIKLCSHKISQSNQFFSFLYLKCLLLFKIFFLFSNSFFSFDNSASLSRYSNARIEVLFAILSIIYRSSLLIYLQSIAICITKTYFFYVHEADRFIKAFTSCSFNFAKCIFLALIPKISNMRSSTFVIASLCFVPKNTESMLLYEVNSVSNCFKKNYYLLIVFHPLSILVQAVHILSNNEICATVSSPNHNLPEFLCSGIPL